MQNVEGENAAIEGLLLISQLLFTTGKANSK